MSKLIYITNMSLDGYVEDETAAFDWVIPDQVHEIHHSAEQLKKPILERSIPSKQLLREEAVEIWKQYKAMPGRVQY